jgi:hypothetical protein
MKKLIVGLAVAMAGVVPSTASASVECGKAGSNILMVSASGVGCIKAKAVARSNSRKLGRDPDCGNLFRTCYAGPNDEWRCRGVRHYRRVSKHYLESIGKAALVRCFSDHRWVKYFVPLSYV